MAAALFSANLQAAVVQTNEPTIHHWNAVSVSEEGYDQDPTDGFVNRTAYSEIWKGSAMEPLTLDRTFTQADLNGIRAQDGFADFGRVVADQDTWSAVSALLISDAPEGAETPTGSLNNLSIVTSVDGIADENAFFDTYGVYQTAGQVTLGGSTLSVQSSGSLNDAGDEDIGPSVIGYGLESGSAAFSASAVDLSAASTGAGAAAVGLYVVADGDDGASASFAGERQTVSISASSTQNTAYGIALHSPDGDRPSNPGSITFGSGTSLQVRATGATTAGIAIDQGKFTAVGPTDVSAVSTRGSAYGLLLLAYGKAEFSGGLTVYANGPEDGYALYMADGLPDGEGDFTHYKVGFDKDGKYRVPDASQSVTFNGQTALNGAVYIGKNATATVNGNVAVTGDFELEGAITGTGSLSINGQKAGYGEVMEGGFIREGASITAGNVTFTNGDFTSHGLVSATGLVTIGSGALYQDDGDLFAGEGIVVAQGGTYKSLYEEDEGETLYHDDGRVVLQGGRFINSRNQTFVNWCADASTNDDPNASVVLEVAAGDYEFDTVTLGKNATLKITGGTLTVDTLQGNNEAATDGQASLTGGKLTVNANLNLADLQVSVDTGGSLESSSAELFTTNESSTTLQSGLTVNGGELIVNDDEWKLAFGEAASSAVSNGKVTFTGTLVDEQGQAQTEVTLDQAFNNFSSTSVDVTASAAAGATQVTVDKNVGAKSLVVESGSEVVVSAGKTLTLFGSSEAGQQLLTFEEADGDAKVSVSGTLQLGSNSADDARGSIAHEVSVSEQGALAVNAGAFELDTVSGKGTITVGNEGAAGTLAVTNLEHTGLIFLDPVWLGGDEVGDGSFFVAENVGAGGALGAQLVVGRNSTAVIGAGKDDAVKAFSQTGLSYGNDAGDNVTAIFYTAKPIDISAQTATGAVLVDGSLASAPTEGAIPAAGSFKVAANGLVMIDQKALVDADSPAVKAQTITLEEGSHIRLVNFQKNSEGTLMIATDEDGLSVDDSVIKDALSTNALVSVTLTPNEETGVLHYATSYNDAEDIFAGFEGNNFFNSMTEFDPDSPDRGTRFLSRMANFYEYGWTGMTAADAVKVGNQAIALAATSGVYNAALDASDLMNRSLSRRMTMAGNFDRSQGFTLWADVLGTANRAKSLYGDGGYDMDLYGAVLGGDVEVVPGAILGAALTVGTGSGGSKDAAIDVDDDVDFVGVSLYGSHQIGNCNGMIDVGYMHTKSDLSAHAFGMSIGDDVSADAWTAGFTAEYKMTVGSVGIVPHIGIRWTRLDVDGYEGAFKTESDTMDVFTLPVGVAFSGKIDAGAWKLAPMVDLSVVPSFGDDEATSKVRWGGASSTIKTLVVDDAPFRASLGLNAQNGSWTIGASYDLGVGGDDRFDNSLTLRARYAF